MKALINRKSIVIVSVAVLIAVSTILSVNLLGVRGPVTSIANAISRPLQSLASQVATVFESIYSSIYRYDDLMQDYEAKVGELTRLKQDYREAVHLREENEYLRAALNFKTSHSEYESVVASVVGKSSSNWSSSFTINIGYSNSVIKRGNAVVTEYGVLIGQVSYVGATESVVVTVLDTTFSTGAYIGESDETATIKGDFALMREGLLMLDHLEEDLVVLPRDTIVTEGFSDVIPSGLVVGEVVEVLRHSTGVGRYATVKPLRDPTTISQVFVIIGFESGQDE